MFAASKTQIFLLLKLILIKSLYFTFYICVRIGIISRIGNMNVISAWKNNANAYSNIRVFDFIFDDHRAQNF